MSATVKAIDGARGVAPGVPPAASEAADPCTNTANALRIKRHFGDQMLYVEGIGWHTWRGLAGPWQLDGLGALRIVQGLGRIVADEAAELAAHVAEGRDSAERKRREDAMAARFKWARASEMTNNIMASLKLAESLLSVKAEVLDAKPMLLGTPNGVLELDTGRFREHRREDHITKTTGCEFDPDAAAPTWARFIGEIFDGNAELIDFVQRLAGYALSGRRGEQMLPILHGDGRNGKTTFLEALQSMLGDYATSGAPGLLIKHVGNEHPTAIADLQGRRLVVVSESGENARLNEGLVKLLTGGDRIIARRMRMDFFEFNPTHLLVLQTNYRPLISGTDEGIWRRLKLIPFTVKIPPERRDRDLPEKLRAELPGILTWCWEGWQKYRAEGFQVPAVVEVASNEYRAASDVVGTFLESCCLALPAARVSSADLYDAYTRWCDDAGERPRSQRQFATQLKERGFENYKSDGRNHWRGLGLLASNKDWGHNVTSAEAYRRGKEGE